MWWPQRLPIRRLLSVYKNSCRHFGEPATKSIVENLPSDITLFKVGEKFSGFRVKTIESIPEFRLLAIHFVHEKTESEYLHLYRNDNNNAFCVHFRTTPMNSTGLPHILEHTVLCGSANYPVRDPFFKMLNRSLATFLNALTGSDYTLYPFCTQNYSDYKNLQKVYLDAVFKPNLCEIDFMQEGWRLEHSNLNDVKSPLIIKGIVFNEMKGAFSENDNIFAQKLQNLILPDHTYGVVSGGDPFQIPNLRWEDLKEFHKQHYHPSNARFFSYGNFPLCASLQYINSEYLSNQNKISTDHTYVPRQRRWKEPISESISSRFENMREPFERQNAIAIAMLLSDVTSIYDTFVLQFVSQLLLKGPNAAFYKTMIEPNFSGGFTPSTGYDVQSRDTIFTVGLQGLKKEDFDRFIKLYDKTLADVAKNGFDPKHIESMLHLYEISIKHETTNFGLHLLFGLTPLWNHEGDIMQALHINRLLKRLKEDIKLDSNFLKNIVKKHFVDNTHRLLVKMSPDKEYDKQLENKEKELIQRKVSQLTDEEKKIIYEKCIELQKEQKADQKTDLLPTLIIDDIDTEIEYIAMDKVTIDAVPVQINKVNSNGIVYFKSMLSAIDLSLEQQMLLPLFCNVITKLGTNKLNYCDFDSLVNSKTAGLNLNVHIGDSLFHLHSYEPAICISSYCLEHNLTSMFDIWTQIFNLKELKDVDRFKTLVQLYMSELTQGLADAGHLYAMQAAAGLVSGSAYQKELLSGLQQISYMKRLIQTDNYKAMLDGISQIAQAVFKKANMRASLNISEESQSNVQNSFGKFLRTVESGKETKTDSLYVTGKVWSPSDGVNCEHHVLNVSVNYCSEAILTAPYNNQDHARLKVLARLLTAKYLHPEIREKNGAYGGGARITQGGVFLFYSYRDPNNLATIDVFDNTRKWLKEEFEKVTDQDILEAKLGVFQTVDAPIAPGNKGDDEFLYRKTRDILQRHRVDIMSVDKKGLQAVGEKYLTETSPKTSGKVVLGPKTESFKTTGRKNEMWTVIENV